MLRCVVLTAFVAAVTQTAAAATRLGICDHRFSLNGRATFLIGVSYYGGLGASQQVISRDLDDCRRFGFNWIRVWATWDAFDNNVSAVNPDGSARAPYLGRLRWLVDECDRRGIVVDVTLSRGRLLPTQEAHLAAVRTIVSALRTRSNWYLDLANEHNVRDARFVSIQELRALREEARRLAPALLVCASHAGDIERSELEDYLFRVQVDFIAPHRPRNASSPAQTAERTRRYLQWMAELGRVVPVHYQEPFRRGYAPRQWEPTAADFMIDLRQARTGGAAGWCLHNGDQKDADDGQPRRSFDLRDKRLFQQLDTQESHFLRSLVRDARQPPTRGA